MKKATEEEIKIFKENQPIIKIVDSIKDYEFTIFPQEEHTFFEVPMQSGKRAIIELYEVKTPTDPGDLHFYHYKFYYYLPQ